MPKPRRIKNLLKSSARSASATAPSLEASNGDNSTPIHPIDTPQQLPQPCQPTPTAPTGLQPSTNTPQGCPSAPVAPTASASHSTTQSDTPSSSANRKRKFGRESNHYWFVDAIDEEEQVTKKMKLKVKDVNNLPDNMRVVVEFDEFLSPIGEAAGLLAGVCGQLATDSLIFPIHFDKWSKMPETLLNRQWDTFLKRRFCFKVDESLARRYVEQSIGKKWREYRIKLWNEFYDPTMSRNEIVNNVPEDINIDHWALFVDYRLRPNTVELCKKNQENRKKQTIPHTCGAKTLARRRDELKKETGKIVGRGPMWNMTHKKKDGSYVSEEAEEIGTRIDQHIGQSLDKFSEISPTDAVGMIFGKEHPGCVRGLGMGVVPTIAFKHNTTRVGGMNLGSASSSTSSPQLQQKVVTLEAQVQALSAYIAMKEGGNMPAELAGLFPNPTPHVLAHDVGSGAASPNEQIRRSSDGSNTHQSMDFPSPHS